MVNAHRACKSQPARPDPGDDRSFFQNEPDGYVWTGHVYFSSIRHQKDIVSSTAVGRRPAAVRRAWGNLHESFSWVGGQRKAMRVDDPLKRGFQVRARFRPAKGGRPSYYQREYCKQFLQHMAADGSLKSFADKIGVSRTTLYNWAFRHPEFLDTLYTSREV